MNFISIHEMLTTKCEEVGCFFILILEFLTLIIDKKLYAISNMSIENFYTTLKLKYMIILYLLSSSMHLMHNFYY